MALDQLRGDIRYALRGARKSPGFAAIAVGTLALGIGVNTAVFSVIDVLLLRKPPYAAPDRLVTLHQKFPKSGDISLGTSPAEFLDYRDRNRAFSALAGYEDAVYDLTGGEEPLRVQAQHVTYNLFATLGVAPMAGRTFTAAEDRPGGGRVAVVSYESWQRHFGGNRNALGRSVRLNEQPYTVIGIMPAGFAFPFTPASVGEPPALWVPMALTPQRIADRAAEFPVHVVARLRPGTSPAQAGRDATRVADDFQREHSDIYTGNLRLEVTLAPLGAPEASRVRPVLIALGGAVVFVLLIACANLTNLLMARAAARKRELAVRCALGASPGRIAAQFLAEAGLLAACGALLGWGLAQLLIGWAAALWPTFLAGMPHGGIDPAVLAFTTGISILATLLCAVAPIVHSRALAIGEMLKQAGRRGISDAGGRLRSALVVFEAASAVALLIGAGLMVHSLLAILRVPLGFSPGGVLIARTTFNRNRYGSGDVRREAERRIVERIAALPGVASVGVTTHVPLADERQIGFILEGEDYHSARWANNALVSGEYFAAMGIPILRGRTFDRRDTPQGPLSAIVNDSMARRFWPNGDALGKRIRWGGRALTVVGIAGDVHIKALDAAVTPTIYTSVYQVESGPATSGVFVVRARGVGAASLASAVRAAIWSVDRGVPVYDMRTMDQIVARSLAARRFAATVLSAFAAVALLLAVIGLYGVLSYAVTQRTAEMGLRMALGATPREVLALVLGSGLRLTGLGLALGAVLGAAGARSLSNLLFDVRTLDLPTFGAAAAILMAVAFLASYLPARRAGRVNPIVALRHE